jgi:hypothetical protein
VSPSFTFGQPVTGGQTYTAVGVTGASVQLGSDGAFNEAGDNHGVSDSYLATRQPSGWLVTPLDPSAETYRGVGIEAASPLDISSDMSRALVAVASNTAPAVDFRFYVRRADGSLEEIGPATSPTKIATWTQSDAEHANNPNLTYAGASPDLADVFFESAAPEVGGTDWLWPGDSTLANASLYEYVGTGHSGAPGEEPERVAVSDGSTVVNGATLPRGMLITECGAGLGGVNAFELRPEDSYNAIADGGARVFFTAMHGGCEREGVVGEGPPSNELYARVDGGTSEAKTVAISEPTQQACSACKTFDSEPAKRFAPFFAGASEDGSRVFFSSEQQLLPGAEEETTSLYEYDFGAPAGQKLTLVAPQLSGVMRVSEDGARVYLVSTAVLAANLDANGDAAEAGAHNMYVYETATAQFTFIAALSPEDSENWQHADAREVQTTPDGQYLLFGSVNDLTPDASGEGRQLYRYNATTHDLTRINSGEDGHDEDGNLGNFFFPLQDYSGRARAYSRGAAMSSSAGQEGRRVFFTGKPGLTSLALNKACAFENREGECEILATNVYEWEEAGDGSCPTSETAGCVYLLSDGQDRHAVLKGSAVSLIGASASGDDVFITSADPLVPQDTDTQMDVYDARIDGGLPVPANPVACTQGCEGSTAVPSLGAPASEAFVGALTPASVPAIKHDVAAKTPGEIRAEKLSRALKACRVKRDRHKRTSCERAAQKRFGAKAVKKSTGAQKTGSQRRDSRAKRRVGE